MNSNQLHNHLHSDIIRIIEKWRPTMSLVRMWNDYGDDSLTQLLSKYCEWWEITKPNYDGLGESLEKIIKSIDKSLNKIDLADYSTLETIFGEDFTKVYDIQQWRNSQIEKIYEKNRR